MGALRGGKLEPKRLRSGKTVNRLTQHRKSYMIAPEHKGVNADAGFDFIELEPKDKDSKQEPDIVMQAEPRHVEKKQSIEGEKTPSKAYSQQF